MKTALLIAKVFFAFIFILSGFFHFYNPEFYEPMIPSFFNPDLVNYVTGILELVVGICLFIPKYQEKAALGLLLLMLVFLPIHIWDYSKDAPMVGSKTNGIIRIIVQLIFIYLSWLLYKKSKTTT